MWSAGPDTHKHTSVGSELRVDFVSWLEKWGDSSNTLLLPSLPIFIPPPCLLLPLFLCRHPSPPFSESTCGSPPRTRTSNHQYQKEFKWIPLLLIFLYQSWDVDSRFHNTEDKTHLLGHVLGYFLVSYQTVAPRFQAPTIVVPPVCPISPVCLL